MSSTEAPRVGTEGVNVNALSTEASSVSTDEAGWIEVVRPSGSIDRIRAPLGANVDEEIRNYEKALARREPIVIAERDDTQPDGHHGRRYQAHEIARLQRG